MAFYDTAVDAEAACFRPCMRCKPTGAAQPDGGGGRMREIAAFIAAHADETLTLEQLGKIGGLSPFHLQRTFKSAMGVSPKEYQAGKRLEAFKSGLRAGESVLGAVFGAGYGPTSRIYEQVDGGLGMAPSAYRAGGAGETIVYVVRVTALGPLLMAATERGVCFVQFGDDAECLVKRLAAEFSKPYCAGRGRRRRRRGAQ